jgi:hypothetical protein
VFELPAESPALVAGLAVAAAAFFAVTASLPARPAPDASGVAGTVDEVAAGESPASATHQHGANELKIDPHGLVMRNDAGISRARFAFGPVTPVGPESPLRAVLNGAHPGEVFESPQAFKQAVVTARSADSEWRPSTVVQVRGVSWDGYRVTLVGV